MRSLSTVLASRSHYLLRYRFTSKEWFVASINAYTSRRHLTEQSHGGKRRSQKQVLLAFPIDPVVSKEEQLATSSGAREMILSQIFMAYDVLVDQERHVIMHDLESFFWLLIWISKSYDGTANGISTTEFEIVPLREHGEVDRLK
jgi:hypothetical protein